MSSRKRKGSPVAYPIRFPLTIVHSSMVRYDSMRVMYRAFQSTDTYLEDVGQGEEAHDCPVPFYRQGVLERIYCHRHAPVRDENAWIYLVNILG